MKKNMIGISVIGAFTLVACLEAPVASASTLRTSSAMTDTLGAPAQDWRQGYDYSWEDETIRDAFRQFMRRAPNRAELRRYRTLMVEDGWSEWEVGQDIREQAREGRVGRQGSLGRQNGPGRQNTDPDSVVRRAYQDLLGREPDAAGLREYRNRIQDNGWSEAQVRQAIRNSPEFRERGTNTMTRERAQDIVRRAYLSVLGREPDPGSAGFVDRVFKGEWTQQDLERELRNSAEFRNKR